MELFLKAFISFFITANPLGASVLILGLVPFARPNEMRATATRATLVAGSTLLLFAFLGEIILENLGISIASFRVAGGALLFIISYRMLFGNVHPEIGEGDHKVIQAQDDIAVFPLGIPLIAGPGCISLSIIMMAKTDSVLEGATIIAAILCVMLITWICLIASRRVQAVLGASGMNLVTRVMGILLASRSVQIIAEGIQGLAVKFHVLAQ